MRETILTAIVLLLLIGNVYQYINCRNCPDATEIVEIRKTDTLTQFVSLQMPEKPVPTPRPGRLVEVVIEKDTFERIVHDTIIKEVNIYRDTIMKNDVTLQFEHMVLGDLLHSNYRITYPESTIINQNRTWLSEYQHQVFFSAEFVTNLVYSDVAIGASYLKGDVLYNYRYHLGQKTHQIGAGLRLFKKY